MPQTARPGPGPEAEAVSPARVPRRTLHTGAQMPAIGFGTFGSDHAEPGVVAEAVRGAAGVGYRHFDCAAVYGNEREIGGALREIVSGGVRREELWITSKLWNDRHGEDDVVPACRRSLADLGLDSWTCTWSTGPFPTSTRPVATSPRAAPTRGPTATRAT